MTTHSPDEVGGPSLTAPVPLLSADNPPTLAFPRVLDATMLSDWKKCPHAFFRRHVQGLVRPRPNIHLHFGACVARGLEVARRGFCVHGDAKDALVDGCEALLTAWGTDFDDFTPITRSERNKTLSNALLALQEYFREWPLDDDDVTIHSHNGAPCVEFSFALPIPNSRHPDTAEPLLYAGRFDFIGDYQSSVYGVDDKTASVDPRNDTWRTQWKLRGQFSGYCLTSDHEVLTPTGWRYISEVDTSTPVAQWHEDSRAITFAYPTRTIELDNEDPLISFEGKVSLLGTYNHRQPLYNTWNDTYKTVTLGTLPKNGSLRFIGAGRYIGGGDNSLPHAFIQLLVALQADGSIRDGRVRFNLQKPRKRERLCAIFDALSMDYDETAYDSGVTEYRPKPHTWLQEAVGLLGGNKQWSFWLLQFSQENLRQFMDELAFWDGSTRDNRGWMYFTSDPTNAEMVQTIAALTGLHSSCHTQQGDREWKVAYRVVINEKPLYAVHTHIRKEVPHKGKVYCLSVPSTYFLVRRNGKICVTGNCWGARSYGLNMHGFLVRGMGVLTDSVRCGQAIIARPPWMVDQWLSQMQDDVSRMCRQYEILVGAHHFTDEPLGHPFPQSFADACADFGGCSYLDLCASQTPDTWLGEYVERRWNPLTREES